MILSIKIEGLDIEYTTTVKPGCNEYCIFKNEIWKVTSIAEDSNNKIRTLENIKTKETITIREELNKYIYLIINPNKLNEIKR